MLRKRQGNKRKFWAFRHLHIAVYNGNYAEVRRILILGADVNAADNYGELAIHGAAFRNQPSIIELLIEYGADVNSRGWQNETPLHSAASSRVADGANEAVETLLAHGADLTLKNDDGDLPIHTAASNDFASIIKLLVRNGADVNARGLKNVIPLHSAAGSGADNAIRILLEFGADKTLLCDKYKTPYDTSLLYDKQSTRDLLRIYEHITKKMIIDHTLIGHLIGKGGTRIREIRDSHPKVQIQTSRPHMTGEVFLTGTKHDVKAAAKTIKHTLNQCLAYITKDVIIDHKLFSYLIGKGGTRIREIKYGYPKVRVNFPRQEGTNPNAVSLTGPWNDVKAIEKAMKRALNERTNKNTNKVIIDHKLACYLIEEDDGRRMNEIVQRHRKVTINYPGLPISARSQHVISLKGPSKDVQVVAKAIRSALLNIK